ncbi:hypothetical protein [Massilia genomosp. 1]|uniref:WG repeat-containing protein n=1 Tax=Massilia genomosp. 1 TaxID=2609280 RepID=A0ABX0MUK4_9BURK|nr:hypothetical protein [Massilia genomosp. 1]NHZ65727.1 hypothetical protein [Massilia genomosp. 1]
MVKSMASVKFLDGCIIEKDYFFTSTRMDAQSESEYDHGRLQWFNAGEWAYRDRHWQVSSVCVLPGYSEGRTRAYVALEQGTGVVGFYSPGVADPVDETLPGAEHGHGIASLLKICEIEKTLYLCGYAGIVMRRINGKWEKSNQSLKAMTFGDYLRDGMSFDDALNAAKLTQRDMRAIGGRASNAIFCVGREGVIFRFDGETWTKIDSPTNTDLNCVYAAEDGFVYAAGNQGILLQGKENNFWALDKGAVDDFYSICWFDGNLYIGGLKGIYRLQKNGLHYVDTNQGGFKCKGMDAAYGQLLVVAERWLLVFDGHRWTRIDHPDNV